MLPRIGSKLTKTGSHELTKECADGARIEKGNHYGEASFSSHR